MPLEPQRRRGLPNAAGTRASQSPASPAERTFLPMPSYKAALAMALGAFLFGCASPELPTPRHPIVPVPVIDLSTRQTGDTVVLTFTMPTISTDQQPLTDTPSVEIYRNAPAQGTATQPKRGAKINGTARLANTIPSSAVEQYQRGARIEFPDKLDPSELSNESGTDLIYTVRTRVSRARASADSNAAALRVYSPPATISDLRVTMTETAPVLIGALRISPAGRRAPRPQDIEFTGRRLILPPRMPRFRILRRQSCWRRRSPWRNRRARNTATRVSNLGIPTFIASVRSHSSERKPWSPQIRFPSYS